MSFIRKIGLDEAEGQLKRIYDGGMQRAGYVAEILQIMSQHPASLQASMALYVSVMLNDDVLPHATRELLASVVSNVNDCYY